MIRMGILLASALVFMLVPLALLRLETPPHWRARLAFITLLGMVASIAVVLAAVLMPEVLVMSSIHQIWQMCAMAFQSIGAHPLARIQSIVAGVALAILLARFWWTLGQGLRTGRRARIRFGEPTWRLERGEPVFVVALDLPEAYAVGTGHGQVIVSRGLLDMLDEQEQEAVLRHEEGHLRARHQPMLMVSWAAAAAVWPIPAARIAMSLIEQAVEEAADEYAAVRLGCPATVASGVSKAALAGLRSPLGAVALGPGPDVPARVRRLLDPPKVPRWVPAACMLAAAALLSLIALTQALAGLAIVAAVHHVVGFGAATLCPLMRQAQA